ncbi:type IV pilin protein [Halomonas sp. G15]|nr:type IV pilin protein [Halomonas sp. G15]
MLTVAGDLERCYTRVNSYLACFNDLSISGRESENKFYKISAPNGDVGASSYKIFAEPQGVQASRDKECGVFTLTHTGVREADGNDCW